MKITDFFSYEELLAVEPSENFVYLSAQYSEFCELSLTRTLTREEEMSTVRSVVRLVSSVFNFPILLACDCYIKMIDIYDYYQEDKLTVMKDLAQALTEHLNDDSSSLKLTDSQHMPEVPSQGDQMDKVRKALEKSWNKDLS